MKTHKFLKGRFTALLLALCITATLLPVTAFASSGSTFEIVLDNVTPDGTLPESLGYVQYAVVDPSESTVRPVNLNVDYDGAADGVTLTTGTTGGENPHVKYTYTVNDNTKQFLLYVTPADGKNATIYTDNQGSMTQIGSVSSSDSPNFLVRNVTSNVRYRVEFRDAGGPAPGGNTDGPDIAPATDAATLQFYDRFNNNFTYEGFKRADLGTVQYSYDQNAWNEFTAQQVAADEKLFWYTDKSDPEPANWKQIYYFSDRNVRIKVTEGALRWSKSGNGSDSTDFVNDNAYDFYNGTGFLNNLYIFPQDDGIRNITWSDEGGADDQKVINGKVIIEKAIIGDENALISDDPYSQQGNKGYIGVKGGATVTVKLIPDYGYQTGSLELNGQRLTSQDEEATYTFTMPNTNLHLRAIFKESPDEIKADATGVTGGSITGGEKVINSGNLRLSVIDSNMTAEQKAQMQNSTAASNTDILKYLEVDLEKFVSKGNSGEEWTEDLEELSEKIEITLNVGTDLDANETYVVVREHNGVYEQIPAAYDKTAGTLTFKSDKFSDYALATVSDSTTGTGNADSPRTGDNSNLWLWISLMIVSGTGLLSITVQSKKRKAER